MTFKGTINGGAPYVVTFDANGKNADDTVVSVGWLQAPGAASIPADTQIVPASQSRSFNAVAPLATNALMMEIDVDVPDNGAGTLTVTQGAKVVTGAITDDEDWLFSVI